MSDESEKPIGRVLPPTVQTSVIPVYNCPAYLSAADESGQIRVRCATLLEVTASGANQREALGRLVERFKQAIIGYRTAGQEIPFVDPPLPAEPSERAVFIAVHL